MKNERYVWCLKGWPIPLFVVGLSDHVSTALTMLEEIIHQTGWSIKS